MNPIQKGAPFPTCQVCGDRASGKHYGVPSCDGCRGFFKRSIRRGLQYVCKEKGNCVIDVARRNQCQACRFKKCLDANMRKEAVQHERCSRTNRTKSPCQYLTSQCSPFYKHSLSLLCSLRPVENPSSMDIPKQFTYVGKHAQFGTHEDEVLNGSEEWRYATEIRNRHRRNLKEPFYEYHNGVNITNDLKRAFAHFPPNPQDRIYELSAKLLFHCVRWARSIPTFLQLCCKDQAILLEETWNDLFIISAAQWKLPIHESKKRRKVIQALYKIMTKFEVLKADDVECTFLKSVVLFSSDAKGLQCSQQVKLLQDHSLCLLHEYTTCSYPSGKIRFGNLLLLLPTVHSVRSQSLEEMFFRKTIGVVPIGKLLCEMFKSS